MINLSKKNFASIGTKNRNYLIKKYKLDVDPKQFEELKLFGRDLIFNSIEILRNCQGPEDLGKTVDGVIISEIKKKFNNDKYNYGDMACKAFVERLSIKTRDELRDYLEKNELLNPNINSLLNDLEQAESATVIGKIVEKILNSDDRLRINSQKYFETARDKKLSEYEDFYKRELLNYDPEMDS